MDQNSDFKRDIYNFWILYTTKNEEQYFREFIKGFVTIWESQLHLDFENPLDWRKIKSNAGPHLSRLPDELIPAMEKFIIIARDKSDNEKLSDEMLTELTLLLKCLIVICRNFDNIKTVIKSTCFISYSIAISNKLIESIFTNPESRNIKCLNSFIQAVANFMEAIFDPVLCWRNYLKESHVEYCKLDFTVLIPTLNVEIVPFVYDYFEIRDYHKYPEISTNMMNVLGAIISGSQENALRAISPATMTILIKLISEWEVEVKLRKLALSCFSMSVLILQKTNPELRQIDLLTILQMYAKSMNDLMETQIFSNENSEKFQLDEAEGNYVDMNALNATIKNIESFYGYNQVNKTIIGSIIFEAKFVSLLCGIPAKVEKWDIDRQLLGATLIRTITLLCSESEKIHHSVVLTDNIHKLFENLRLLGKPNHSLVEECLRFAFRDESNLNAIVVKKLIEWINEMPDKIQDYLSGVLLQKSKSNSHYKRMMCEVECINVVCLVLQGNPSKPMSSKCICNLIRFIEELAKFSIKSVELKNLFKLIRVDNKFDHRKLLSDVLIRISSMSLLNINSPATYFDIQTAANGIHVSDIRKWDPTNGFFFHTWIRLQKYEPEIDFTDGSSSNFQNYRRYIFSLITGHGQGFEIFVQKNGNLIVGVITKKDYYATTTHSDYIVDGRWHSISVLVNPPKRLFSYYQINIFIDGMQKVGSNIKFSAFNEPFMYCSIGIPHSPVRHFHSSQEQKPTEEKAKSVGLFPNLLEKSIFSHMSSLTLPLKSSGSMDPSVKTYPMGMQDIVFGPSLCLKGQMSCAMLTDSSINYKAIFEAGAVNIPNILAIDIIEGFELGSKFIFCFSPRACYEELAIDTSANDQHVGHIKPNICRSISIQNSINNIGGIVTVLPMLENLSKSGLTNELMSLNEPDLPEKNIDDNDWEVLDPNLSPELKIIQNPLASFFCLLKNFISNHDLNQECFLRSDCISIISKMVGDCHFSFLDVNLLMALQLLVENMQAEVHKSNMDLLNSLYSDLVFDFRIWSRTEFQIMIGHIQYISAIIKNDRKYFRKHFGVQFILDIIQQYFISNSILSETDTKTVRDSLYRIIRYYLLKEINIKEVTAIITFLLTIKNDVVITETLSLLTHVMENKNCKDQIFLLIYEPQVGELLYALLAEKCFDPCAYSAIVKFLNYVLKSDKVQNRHKSYLRLVDPSIECNNLYHGLYSFMLPMDMESSIILDLLDMNLNLDTLNGYSAALCLIYHLHLSNLTLKLEICRRLLNITFNKTKSAQFIAKQIGWQESLARLLIKNTIEHVVHNENKDKTSILSNVEEMFNTGFEIGTEVGQDLMVFDDDRMELVDADENGASKNNSLLAEAANAIENEMKEIAGTVESVVENISSVYSVIRQTTSDIQDTIESFASSSFDDNSHNKKSVSLSSSDENISLDETLSKASHQDLESCSLKSKGNDNSKYSPATKSFEESLSEEETLVYLLTNILFTIMWRGVENKENAWKDRGQVFACINLIGLNNELYTSHLTLRLKMLEMGIQSALIDLADGDQNQIAAYQQNAIYIMRMVYDLVVLDTNEDDSKKCSLKLLDGVNTLMDALMVFEENQPESWPEMMQISFGILLKCICSSNSDIQTMATSKFHALIQKRQFINQNEVGYILFSLNKIIQNAIEIGNIEQYSYVVPIMKMFLEKNRMLMALNTNTPDLPSTSSGPSFMHEFQMYCTSKQWIDFIDKKIKVLYQQYQKFLTTELWEPLNRFWSECYESCKLTSQKRAHLQMESRKRFQERILNSYRVRQSEESARLNVKNSSVKAKTRDVELKWKLISQYLYGIRGPWAKIFPTNEDVFWKLSHRESSSRMRLKLVPSLNHDPHTTASNLRDNTAQTNNKRLSADISSTFAPAIFREESNDEEIILLEEEIRNSIEAEASDKGGKEKLIITQDCELITLMARIKGRLDVFSTYLMFTDQNSSREDENNKDFRFNLWQIREVHLRKYNLRRSALEIFLVDQTSYFLNFTTKTRNKVFTKILSLQPPNILYNSGRSPIEILRLSGLTQKWMNREISNFEYLMHLNTIAGRSTNDLSQYPVFPWILADYTSEVLDLSNPNTFRDLGRPIGVVNPKNEDEVRTKYEGFEDPSGMIPKFHYGTHYSNSAGVLHYMIRVEPFTSLHIELQSGRFDVADRQFHSIAQSWNMLMDNPNDVKELIPEFFYFPEFLKNMNNFDLGIMQQTKERVHDVILPPWAKTPEDFIAIHRRALESEYVSANLHKWIDLIFGYKQKGPKAVEALNVFYYCSYEGAVDLDKIDNPLEREAVEGMINNFGQVPSQLMKEPHPKRLNMDELLAKLLKSELKRPDLTQFLDRVIKVQVELATDRDPVVYMSPPRSPPRSFLQNSPDLIVSITKNGILGCHSWMSFDKEKGFNFELDATTFHLKNRKKIIGPFHPEIRLNSNLFGVSLDGKYLYAGGMWDNSLRIFNTARVKPIAFIVRHLDVITCLSLDNCGSYLITGSRDCTSIIWSINNSNNNTSTTNSNKNVKSFTLNTSLVPKPVQTLYGHDRPISCVAIMTELDLAVSGSIDGTVNVYTIEEGQFIRTLKPLGCTGLKIEISYITISYQGQIAFSALDDTSHSVHVFSINGVNLGSKYVSGRVTGLTTVSDFLVVADDAGDLTMSRLYGLKPVFDVPLHIPTQTIISAPGNTHFLTPLRDGSLAVVGVQQPIPVKKHLVQNV